MDEALALGLSVSVVVGSQDKVQTLEDIGVQSYVIDRTLTLEAQQQWLCSIVKTADIVITTARKPGQKAPLLIPQATLDVMKPHAVIVDMTISEGGNVAGSQHDRTIHTARDVLITNVSGYPKIVPHEASVLWSKASLLFILAFAENPDAIALQPC